MHNYGRFVLLPLFALAFLSSPLSARPPKLKSEEVVSKHLEAIGPAEKRARIRTRAVDGRARMKIGAGAQGLGAQGLAVGTLVIVSEGSKYRVALPFRYTDYWGEEFAFDGARAAVGFSYIQRRSPFGDFLYRFDLILEEGLLSGVLSTAWPLLSRDEKQPKLEYAGLKDLGGQKVHVLNYRRKKGQADMRIELFFDAETFRHVRTAYNLFLAYDAASAALSESHETRQEQTRPGGRVIQEKQPAVQPQDPGRQGGVYRLEEFFSNFQDFDGIALPTRWNIVFERATGNRTAQREWAIVIDRVTHNQPLGRDAFALEQRTDAGERK